VSSCVSASCLPALDCFIPLQILDPDVPGYSGFPMLLNRNEFPETLSGKMKKGETPTKKVTV
jgi:hypothetical protein